MDQLRAVWKWLQSFFVQTWKLEDYPIKFVRHPTLPVPESERAKGWQAVPWSVVVVNWRGLDAIGLTRDEALEKLRAKFEQYRENNVLPRPGRAAAMEMPGWYEPADPTPRHQCPCCDYVSLPERGNFLICEVCFWEDNGQDLEDLEEESGPNKGLTLRQARANFKQFGACDPTMLKHVLPAEERKRYAHSARDVA